MATVLESFCFSWDEFCLSLFHAHLEWMRHLLLMRSWHMFDKTRWASSTLPWCPRGFVEVEWLICNYFWEKRFIEELGWEKKVRKQTGEDILQQILKEEKKVFFNLDWEVTQLPSMTCQSGSLHGGDCPYRRRGIREMDVAQGNHSADMDSVPPASTCT